MKLNPFKKENDNIRKIVPAVNIYESDKEVILEAEMVGLSKNEISVGLKGDELTVRGVRKDCEVPKGYTALHQERCPLAYERTFVLSDEVNKELIGAQYDGGILKLTIPKSEKFAPKHIEIKG